MQTLTPVDVTAYRGHTYAADSLDHQWQYQMDAGRWSVTHVPTGRRYWTPGLEQARADTADGTAARVLSIGAPLPHGKPMARGEHRAVCGELSTVDQVRMVAHVRNVLPRLVADAARQVGFRADHGTTGLGQILGIVYGTVPSLWLDALETVRPDLIPPHLSTHPAAQPAAA